jgi:hypothetical protein
LRKRVLSLTGQFKGWIAVGVVAFALSGCLGPVKRTTRVPASEAPAPALEATLSDLLARLDNQSGKIQTLTATVDLQPTAGSVYSGVINEYHDVKGFILLKKPSLIRILGQAPVVRTNIFDMVSDGQEFRLNIPPKQKFIVGETTLRRPAKNALENLRPQHILDALVVAPIDHATDKLAFEQDEADGRQYYVITILKPSNPEDFQPVRKIWFSRTDLNVSRVQIYGTGGALLEDVHYSRYQDFSGTTYPSNIQLRRPAEDYELAITIERAAFNQEISPEKFELKKPQNAQLIDLTKEEAGDGK